MADTKASALGTVAAPAATDLFYIVDDPGGTPASGKATVWTCVMAGLVVPAAGSGAGTDYRWKGQDAGSGDSAGGALMLEPGLKSGSGADGAVIVQKPGGTSAQRVTMRHEGSGVGLKVDQPIDGNGVIQSWSYAGGSATFWVMYQGPRIAHDQQLGFWQVAVGFWACLSAVAAGIMALTKDGTDGAALELVEIADPAAPASNKARLFCRDNGSGKTQICALFPTGAVQVIATEP